MFAKLHLLSQDEPEGGGGLRWRAHPYLRVVGAVPKGPAVFDWNARQREDLEALWRDPSADGARERLAKDLAAFCDKLGWAPDAAQLEDAEKHGDEYLLTLSSVPPELYILPWEVIQVGAAGTYLSDYASAQVRYAMPGLEPRANSGAPPKPGVLFAWSAAGGAVPHEEQAAALRGAAEAGGVEFRELAEVDEGTLQAALDAGPPSVLHLLCHGLPGPAGEPPRVKWGKADAPSEVTATRLARMLRQHGGAIRLVVLSACGSGDGHGDPLFMGSMAQELHKKGIPNVVASRYPLSVRGSRVMTRALYDKLLREAWSLERALRHTRQALFRADEDGESHPGDAYGMQLYAYDTERFVSDNQVEAERPVLASYPFGTAARPVPAKAPPAAALTLDLEEPPELDAEQLVEKLRRLSEDTGLVIEVRPGGRALLVRTTVDGSQRLLDVWRSKTLQRAVGVAVAGLFVMKGIAPAFAATAAATAGQAAGGQAAAGQAAAGAGQAVAGNVAAAGASKAAVAATGKAAAAVAGKVVATKIAIAAVVGTAAIGGGAVVYTQTRPSAPTAPGPPAALAGQVQPDLPPLPEPPGVLAQPPPPPPPPPKPPEEPPPIVPPAPGSDGPPALVAPPGPRPAEPPPPPSPSPSKPPKQVNARLALVLGPGAPATPYRSRNYGKVGTGKTVGFIVPAQAGVSGPTSMVWGGPSSDSKLTVTARGRTSGKPQVLTFSGSRPSACGPAQMNDAVLCGDGKEESILSLTILEDDNASVPAGEYVGSFEIQAKGWHDQAFAEKLVFAYAITINKAAPAPPSVAAVPPVEKEAGPLWNQQDAETKCPGVCGPTMTWDGNWRITVAGTMSVCSCIPANHEPPRPADPAKSPSPETSTTPVRPPID